jgi:hypothetical protein
MLGDGEAAIDGELTDVVRKPAKMLLIPIQALPIHIMNDM